MTKGELIRVATEGVQRVPYREGIGVVVVVCEIATGDIAWATSLPDNGTTAALLQATMQARASKGAYPVFHADSEAGCGTCGTWQADARETMRSAGVQCPAGSWPCACRTDTAPTHMVY